MKIQQIIFDNVMKAMQDAEEIWGLGDNDKGYLELMDMVITQCQNQKECLIQRMIEERIEQAKKEILTDVKHKIVPRSVKSFSELHDYVDANCYGGGCEDCEPYNYSEKQNNEAMCDFWNAVQNSLDAWIKSGGIE